MNFLNKLNNIQENINILENNIKFKCKIILPANFLTTYYKYKLTLIILFNDSNFYYDCYNILDNENTEIWIYEHCDLINNYIKFTSNFYNIIKTGFFYGFISFIQYKLSKIILKKINNIWYSDYFLNKIYNHKKKCTLQELEFILNIIELVYYKIYINNYDNDTIINEKSLLDNNYYIDNIYKKKLLYQKYFNSLHKI